MKKIFYTLSFLIGVLFLFTSCKDFGNYFKEQFPEIASDTTYIRLNGTVIVPVASSEVSLGDLLPKTQDSNKYWIEVDSNNLFHIMSRKDSVLNFGTGRLGYSSPVNAGTPIPEATIPGFETQEFKFPSPKNIPGIFYFFDPKITLYVDNNIVLDMVIQIRTIDVRNSATGQTGSYSANIDVPVTHATDQSHTYTQTLIDTSNFPDFPSALSILPDYIKLGFQVYLPSQTLNYDMTPDQQVVLSTLVDLPLVFYAHDVTIIDTTDFKYSLAMLQEIDSLAADLKAIIDNGIPLGGRLYLILANETVTDTIGVIPAGTPDLVNDTVTLVIGTKTVVASAAFKFLPGEVDSIGNPNKVVQTISHLKLPQYLLENLRDYNVNHPGSIPKLIIVGKFNTYHSDQGQVVRIYSTNKLKIRLGLKTVYDATVSTNDTLLFNNNNNQ